MTLFSGELLRRESRIIITSEEDIVSSRVMPNSYLHRMLRNVNVKIIFNSVKLYINDKWSKDKIFRVGMGFFFFTCLLIRPYRVTSSFIYDAQTLCISSHLETLFKISDPVATVQPSRNASP